MIQLPRQHVLILVVAAVLLAVTPFTPLLRWLGITETQPVESSSDRRAGFQDRAQQSGLTFRMMSLPTEQGEKFKVNLYDHGCGVAVGDYDGDGHEDVYFVNQLGPNALFRNRGDGSFVDVTTSAGVALGDRVCVAATFADYDNDGHQDLFVTSTRGGNVMFRNRGDGTFQDVTKQAGLTHVGHSQAAVFFDFDNDGHLDLLIANTAQWTTAAFDAKYQYYPAKTFGHEFFASPKEANVLYRNNGNGTFTDITVKAGLTGRGWSGDVAVLDFNEDGYLDLLVTNMFGPSQLYRNNGNGTFTDVTRQALGATSYGACGAKAFDFNNDGKLDLLLADMHSDMWTGLDWDHLTLKQAKQSQKIKFRHLQGPNADFTADIHMADLLGFRIEEVVFGNTFFKNLGGGKFQELSAQANLETFWPWGIATGDFDNDGYEDVFLPSGMGFPFYYWPNQLMMNNGNETFTERGQELGIEPPERGLYLEDIGGKKAYRSSRSAAVADFDGDGRLEIVTNNFNDEPYYFRNNFPCKNYVAFRLQGTKSNRDAIGALVKLHVGKKILVRLVSPAGGYLAQSSRTAHFGLGDLPRIDRVEIKWPSGLSQRIDDPEINRLHKVVEGQK